MRLSLTNAHVSQLEQESALTEAQGSPRDTFAQEIALLKAQHQAELDHIRQQEKLRELQQQPMSECE